MALMHLEHVLVQTEDLEGTKDWYVRVLGLEIGPHPDFKFPVYWLYAGGRDVVHLTAGGTMAAANRVKYIGQESTAVTGSGVIDHIAFRAEGLRAMMAHLDAIGVGYKQRQVNDQGLYQLFVFDPNGVKVELNYAAAEAEGLTADVVAANL